MAIKLTNRSQIHRDLHAQRPVVTGIGVVHPVGFEVDDLWIAIISGVPNFVTIGSFGAESFDCDVAGIVDSETLRTIVEPRTVRSSTHATQLALVAAGAALRSSGLGRYPLSGESPHCLCVGTALGGWVQAEQQHTVLVERGAKRVNPFLASGAPHHATAVELAATLGIGGQNITFASGCAASVQAISYGAELIRQGQTSVCICGGTESPISPVTVASMCRSGELTRSKASPNEASRPFDRLHDGLVLSEGSCFLVLESYAHASERGACMLAEVVAGEHSCDAKGLFNMDSTGAPSADALQRLSNRTGVTPDQIDYVCAHANSSPAFDRKEVVVLKRAFGEFAAKIPVSSIKGVLGHPFGASGAFQTAAAALAMKHGLIPHTHNLVEPDPECDLDLVMGEPRPATIRHALITSYGYGGVNSFLLLRNPNL